MSENSPTTTDELEIENQEQKQTPECVDWCTLAKANLCNGENHDQVVMGMFDDLVASGVSPAEAYERVEAYQRGDLTPDQVFSTEQKPDRVDLAETKSKIENVQLPELTQEQQKNFTEQTQRARDQVLRDRDMTQESSTSVLKMKNGIADILDKDGNGMLEQWDDSKADPDALSRADVEGKIQELTDRGFTTIEYFQDGILKYHVYIEIVDRSTGELYMFTTEAADQPEQIALDDDDEPEPLALPFNGNGIEAHNPGLDSPAAPIVETPAFSFFARTAAESGISIEMGQDTTTINEDKTTENAQPYFAEVLQRFFAKKTEAATGADQLVTKGEDKPAAVQEHGRVARPETTIESQIKKSAAEVETVKDKIGAGSPAEIFYEATQDSDRADVNDIYRERTDIIQRTETETASSSKFAGAVPAREKISYSKEKVADTDAVVGRSADPKDPAPRLSKDLATGNSEIIIDRAVAPDQKVFSVEPAPLEAEMLPEAQTASETTIEELRDEQPQKRIVLKPRLVVKDVFLGVEQRGIEQEETIPAIEAGIHTETAVVQGKESDADSEKMNIAPPENTQMEERPMPAEQTTGTSFEVEADAELPGQQDPKKADMVQLRSRLNAELAKTHEAVQRVRALRVRNAAELGNRRTGYTPPSAYTAGSEELPKEFIEQLEQNLLAA